MADVCKRWWSWVIMLVILVLGGWFASYRLAEPGWEMNHQGNILTEWPHYAANYLRFGYLATRLGMVTDYGWTVPSQGFHFRIDHPPLTSLFMSLSYQIFGVREWSARLVPLLSSLGLVVLIFVLARQIAGNGWALLAAVFAIASPALQYFARLPVPHVPAVPLALATFMLYRKWTLTKERRYLLGMWSVFVVGAWTDWVVYFVMPWVLIHYLLFGRRTLRDRRFIVVGLLLPFIVFAIYILWGFVVGGEQNLRQLLDVFLFRSLSVSAESGRRYIVGWSEMYPLAYGRLILFFTSTLCALALVWIISVAGGFLLRRRVSSDQFLVLCLLGYGVTHDLAFKNRVYFHNYITPFELIPFFALAGMLGVRALSVLVGPRWRAAATAVMVGAVVVVFLSQSARAVPGLHQEDLKPGFYLAGRQINEMVPREGKVMLSFRPDSRLAFYMDRPWTNALSLEAFEAGLAGGEYTHYIYGPGSGRVSADLRRRLAERYPVRLLGDYAVFDLREGATGTKLLGDEDESDVPPVGARFGDQLELVGYRIEPAVVRQVSDPDRWEAHWNAHADLTPDHNTAVKVQYCWRRIGQTDKDYTVQAELVKDYGVRHVLKERYPLGGGAYGTSQWRDGELVCEEREMDMPGFYPPLRYDLRLRIADGRGGDPLVLNGGTDADLILPGVEVQPTAPPHGMAEMPVVEGETSADVGAHLQLRGYSLGGVRQAKAGERVPVRTVWRTDAALGEDHPAWVELRAGTAVVRSLLGVEPTRLWEPDRYYERPGELKLSPYLLPGRYGIGIVGEDGADERRVELRPLDVQWAGEPRRVLASAGVANGAKGDVKALDEGRPLELEFELEEPRDLKVVAAWVGEALCEETRVEVYLQNRLGEHYLGTWQVPRGSESVNEMTVPKALTEAGENRVVLRVPENRPKPKYVGWRAWVDAIFPDLLYDESGPHDGWIWPDYVEVNGGRLKGWRGYEDLARAYTRLGMDAEVLKLSDDVANKGLRPDRAEGVNVFLEALARTGDEGRQARVQELLDRIGGRRLGLNLSDKVELLGYSYERTGREVGRFRLVFRSLAPLDEDYTVWLHRYEEGAEVFESLDRLAGSSKWKAGNVYEVEWRVKPMGGKERYVLGMWRGTEESRLEVKGEPGRHEIDLGWIEPQ